MFRKIRFAALIIAVISIKGSAPQPWQGEQEMPYAVKPKPVIQEVHEGELTLPSPGYEYWILHVMTGKTEQGPFPTMEEARLECERLNQGARERR